MTSTAGPGRPRRWTAGLAWALWLASLLCLAAVPWLDELLRQAGRRMDYATATPEVIADAIATELGRAVDYRPVETDGAARAANLIAELV